VATYTADLGTCNADLTQAQADLNTCTTQLAAAQKFPATGQTTCYTSGGAVTPCTGTGQDGGIQAGTALSYTDNGDGTITDNNTGLMWEKKDDNNAGGIHDMDVRYAWADALGIFIPQLNNRCAANETVDCTTNGDADCSGVGGACGFAGHRDWRLPNVKELQSIVNYQNSFPSVSAAFNTGCAASCTVLTCSCTYPANYWSSTTIAAVPGRAWYVRFEWGDIFFDGDKSINLWARGVRGGL
jgi:hypothetical protein